MRLHVLSGFIMFLILPIVALANDGDVSVLDSTLSISGVVDFSMGEVVKGMYHSMKANGDEAIKKPATIGHAWFGNPLARLNFNFKPSENMEVLLGFEGNIFVCTFPPNLKTTLSSNGGIPVFPQWMDWRIHQAQGIFSLLNSERTSLHLSLGLMPYKYNPEVRNLGEFLFRSGTYPFFLINNFNFPLARLSGMRLNFNYASDILQVTFDQFILTERNNPPLNDISLASIVGLDFMKLANIGLGIDFDRIISVNSNLTTPKAAKYATAPGDTGLYSFQGTKVMARATIDPFRTLRGGNGSFTNDLLGDNGGKFYGEVAIIGLKNYPASAVKIDGADSINPWGYTSIKERMPWMVGVNVPMWKLLDVCAFELEYYPAPYPNDYYQAFMNQGLPIPTWISAYHNDTTAYSKASYLNSPWYWSLYMKKQIARHLSVLGQISRDHMRWDVNLGNENNYDTEQIMALMGQWAWRVGILFEF